MVMLRFIMEVTVRGGGGGGGGLLDITLLRHVLVLESGKERAWHGEPPVIYTCVVGGSSRAWLTTAGALIMSEVAFASYSTQLGSVRVA